MLGQKIPGTPNQHRTRRKTLTSNTIANISLIKAGERPTRGGNGSNHHKKKESTKGYNITISKKGTSKDGIFARLLRDSKAGNEQAKEVIGFYFAFSSKQKNPKFP